MAAGRNRLRRQTAALLALCALLGAGTAGCRAENAEVSAAGPALVEQPTDGGERLIALTFDDGPSPSNTPRLLDGLARRGVQATFFLVGSMVETRPDLAERIAAEGHQLGVHTYDHSSSSGLRGLTQEGFDRQVGVTARLLTQLTGQTEFALRPPYGFVDDGVRSWSPGPIVLWSVDPEDWKYHDAQRVARHILSNAEDGAIILLHDIFSTSVDAALAVVDQLQAEGYRFVTVDQLFAARGVDPRRGEVYHSAYS